MKKAKIAMLVLITGLLLFGCADRGSTSTFTPSQNSIFVTREGVFSSALVETDEKGYYDQEGLKAFLEGYVAEYNAERGGDRVKMTSCTLGDGKGIAVFEYASGADLYDFATEMEDSGNQAANLQMTTISEGLVAGKVSDGTWIKAKDGSSVSVEAMTKQGNLKLVSLEGAVTIQTEGTIQYYSGDITLQDEFTAVVAGGKAYIAFQ